MDSPSYCAIRSILPANIPNNEGVFRAIEVSAPLGPLIIVHHIGKYWSGLTVNPGICSPSRLRTVDIRQSNEVKSLVFCQSRNGCYWH